MNNLLHFNKSKNNIRFVVRTATIELYRDRKTGPVMKKHAVIMLKNVNNGKEIIHPLNQFIVDYYRNKSYNSMSVASFGITSFLNWLFFDREHPLKDLEELTISCATEFLFSQTKKGNVKSTVKSYENIIYQFYVYLSENSILKNIQHSDILNLKDKHFKKLIYNQNPVGERIHDFKTELIIPFIETAYNETNPIALGVYYQFFGGIRMGEIVNITKSNIRNIGSFGEFGQIVKITDTNLRTDLTTTSGTGEVKKNRSQPIFPYRSLLKKLYNNHLKMYRNTDTDALFLNRDGNPMSGESYRKAFKNLQILFVENLKKSNDIRISTYGHYLDSMKWSTHIGRGVFSNLLAEYTDNVLEVAVSRGDSNLNSSLTYIADTKRIMNKLQKELELLYNGDFLD
ncbi:hypothetical protein J7I80_03450 [Bacillus sp. ISL-41]|uniref:site-specific integrase n=1 Tax=Bacillus sp. ISL-41 TaxID=2819127 RepID=UPI001BE64FF5|nr:site-specific integrase [Bacillus sp. ISL-41]MBT2641284.1 hypothetical protein [Bacillus sp. ISL-41]